MQMVVHVDAPGSGGAKVWLRENQCLRVGRTEWADLAVPEDPALAVVHFELHSAHSMCWVRDLDTTAGTFVNGALVVEHRLQDGDVIEAGATRFHVAIRPS